MKTPVSETLTHVFFCENCKTFKSSVFYGTTLVVASGNNLLTFHSFESKC